MHHENCNAHFIGGLMNRTGMNPVHHSVMLDGHRDRLNELWNHLEGKAGGGYSSGGAYSSGGSLHTAGSFDNVNMGGGIDTPKKLYHDVLKMNPRKWELMREMASQTLGARPSPMWGDLKAGTMPAHYRTHLENILRMPSPHGAARLVEAEHGYGKGAGFSQTLRHIKNKVTDLFNANKHKIVPALSQFASNKLTEYTPKLNDLMESNSKIKSIMDPINRTIQAVSGNPSSSLTDIISNHAQKQLAETAEKYKSPELANYVKEAIKVAQPPGHTEVA